jgi:FkbM family methyltransferase
MPPPRKPKVGSLLPSLFRKKAKDDADLRATPKTASVSAHEDQPAPTPTTQAPAPSSAFEAPPKLEGSKRVAFACVTLVLLALTFIPAPRGFFSQPRVDLEERYRLRVNATVPPWLGPPIVPLKPPFPPLPDINAMFGETKSQWGEDVFVYREYFHGRRGAVVLESGAVDGVTFSNTHMLEAQFGWRSILIEGSPRSYRLLAKNRPNALTINAVLCKAEETRDLHYIDPSLGVGDEAVGDTAVSGIWEFMSEELKVRWWPQIDAAAAARLPLVPCRPLSHLLDTFSIYHIDLWFLDVEGAELTVLESVDFTKVSISAIMVEMDGTLPDKDDAVREKLASEGYVFERNGHNFPEDPYHMDLIPSSSDLWLHKDFIPCARRFNRQGDGCLHEHNDGVPPPWQ